MEKKKKDRTKISGWRLNDLLHNTSEGVSPCYEIASNCAEHPGSHHGSVCC